MAFLEAGKADSHLRPCASRFSHESTEYLAMILWILYEPINQVFSRCTFITSYRFEINLKVLNIFKKSFGRVPTDAIATLCI